MLIDAISISNMHVSTLEIHMFISKLSCMERHGLTPWLMKMHMVSTYKLSENKQGLGTSCMGIAWGLTGSWIGPSLRLDVPNYNN